MLPTEPWPRSGADGLPYWEKDPLAVKDYSEDYTAWLAGDTIVNSTWASPAGITRVTPAFTTTKATVWLTGGTHGQVYKVTNTIITLGGRTEIRSFNIRVQNQ